MTETDWKRVIDQAAEHDQVTRRCGSHARTRANIAEAVRRQIPIRVAVVEVLDGQRVGEAAAELRQLGVTHVGLGRMRGVGRGAGGGPDVNALCGHCGRGRAAVSPDGDVWPCVLGRWESTGNVLTEPLAGILAGPRMRATVAAIPLPQTACDPGSDGNDCKPAETIACPPKYS